MGGDDSQTQAMNSRIDQQQQQVDAQVESRRESLTRTRMDIVKTLDTPRWNNPDQPSDNVNTL